MTPSHKVSVAMSAVAPTPIRLVDLEKQISEKSLDDTLPEWLESEIKNHIKPISDIRSSADYRLHISGVLAKKGMKKLLEMGGK
jgi:carbon-monoxide dehydrogenase medium subunit